MGNDGNSWVLMMKKIAQAGIDNQEFHDGDFLDDDDILICGKCGQPRQVIKNMEKYDISPFKVVCNCKCDEERIENEKIKRKHLNELKRIEKLRRISLMDDKLIKATFDNAELNKSNEQNIKICKRYCKKFNEMEKKNQGLLLWGGVGTGKSFSAACIANYLIDNEISVVMTSLVKILTTINNNLDAEQKIMDLLSSARLVIFDDLGAERSTDYALEKIYNIIDSRYRTGKPMIFTTNLTLNLMKQETDVRYARIYDRIFECCYPLQFTGNSWRKKTASQHFIEMNRLFENESDD